MSKYLILLLLAFGLNLSHLSAQETIKDTGLRVYMIGGAIAGDIKKGDLAKRFGNGITVGGFLTYKSCSNWLFSLEYAYMYGSNIVENSTLDSISTKDPSNRYIINSNGEYQILSKYESGNLVFFKIGKVLPFLSHNPNSGIAIKIGGGFMEHKIYYYWTGDAPTQLSGNYLKGYDRLTYGPAISQSIGYHFMGNNGRVNFTFDFEAIEGFTYNQRAYNFDLMSRDDKQRLDVLLTIKLGWFFPLYGKRSNAIGYYY